MYNILRRLLPSSPSSILHLLPTPLLQLSLSLTCRRPRLRHPRRILKPTPHPRIRRPRQPHAVHGNHTVKYPRPIAQEGHQQQYAICPVRHVPEVLRQSFRLEVIACALDGAVGEGGRARLALENEVDEELGGGEEEVEEERSAGEGGAEEEGAVEPEEEVDYEGRDEGLVEAAGVGCGEGFDCFLGGM